MMSDESSVGFLRKGATLAFLNAEGTQPVVRDELMREVSNGRWSGEGRRVAGFHLVFNRLNE